MATSIHLCTRASTFAGSIPGATAWLLADCMEQRGRQGLWESRKPEVLRALRERAVVQSVESSNRIEGVTVDADRLRPLVMGKVRPRDRSEEGLAGYRRALAWVFEKGAAAPVDARLIRHLHLLAQDGAGDAGVFKSKDNEIIELMLGQGRQGRRVRFVPTSAKSTPEAVDALCDAYGVLSGENGVPGTLPVPALLLVATVVFDFLCIHPFRDGNGRVARLLTTLLLERHGFTVARFVSLERLVEERREEYYESLRVCSEGWHDGKNTVWPWTNFLLSVVRRAYGELASEVEAGAVRGDGLRGDGLRGGKRELVELHIMSRVGWFTLAELRAALPEASAPLIKKVLGQMKESGKVRFEGRGRSARWVRS